MKVVRPLLAASLLIGLLGSPAAAARGAACSVSPDPTAVGSDIVVTVSGVTFQMARYGWFVLYDEGPTTTQAVSTLDQLPYHGDNGSYLVSFSDGVAVFHLTVQPDPGVHLVLATYRKVFASCSYVAASVP